MHIPYRLRWATRDDYRDPADVMFEAVRHGPSRYTERQRAAWLPRPHHGAPWDTRLDRQRIVLAHDAISVAGFMSLEPVGYVDFAYIRPASQGRGLFRQLFAWIEQDSIARGNERLWVHASLMAQPAFAAMGFTVVEHEVVQIDGEHLARARMEKVRAAAL